jgi:hypothetical protein
VTPVADLAHEAARRYVDAIPLADLARELLQRAGAQTWAAYPPFVNDLERVLRTVLEAALVEYLTIPQLTALARFYSTPEGAAVMGKLCAVHDVVALALQVAVGNWARELDARIRALSSAGVPAPPKEEPR